MRAGEAQADPVVLETNRWSGGPKGWVDELPVRRPRRRQPPGPQTSTTRGV